MVSPRGRGQTDASRGRRLFVMKPSVPPRLIRVARLALAVARESFPKYAHAFSPHFYELPSLVASVVMKVYLRQDYRGMEEILKVSPPLREALGLTCAPHYSTLARAFAKALDEAKLNRMMEKVLRRTGVKRSAVAVDSTGFQTTTASAYFETRRGGKGRRWAKLSVAAAVPCLALVSAHAGQGPSSDKTDFLKVMEPAAQRLKIPELYADAGYDAERIHHWCRVERNIRSFIPLAVRRKDGSAGGWWRGLMNHGLPPRYGRRWGVETVFSVIKRKWGGQATARTEVAQRREAVLKAAVYAIYR